MRYFRLTGIFNSRCTDQSTYILVTKFSYTVIFKITLPFYFEETPVGSLDVMASSQAFTLRKGVFDTTLMEDVKLAPPINYSPEQLVSEGTISLTTEDLEKFLSSSSAEDIVDNLATRLNIDSKTLEKPDEQSCRILRCFSHCVRSTGRLDVLEMMKRRLPEGSTGILK